MKISFLKKLCYKDEVICKLTQGFFSYLLKIGILRSGINL